MSGSKLYLILHKVRGEPAFDIAQKLCSVESGPCQPGCAAWNGNKCSNADRWIIPTSGHRAYPSWDQPLVDFLGDDIKASVPDDLPDHYDAKRDDGSHLVNAARDILLRKGLISPAKPAQPMFRRA